MDLMDINPLNSHWIWEDFLIFDDYKALYQINRRFRFIVGKRKNYWIMLILNAWWYDELRENYPIHHVEIKRSFFKVDYFQWKSYYNRVHQALIKKIFVRKNKRSKNTTVFGDKYYHVTKYWSYFNHGNFIFANSEDLVVQVLHHDHGFTDEVGSDKPNCRAFVRNQSALKAYYVSNMIRLKTGLKIIQ